eukprot:4301234-Prymnesium_polylepis.1
MFCTASPRELVMDPVPVVARDEQIASMHAERHARTFNMPPITLVAHIYLTGIKVALYAGLRGVNTSPCKVGNMPLSPVDLTP